MRGVIFDCDGVLVDSTHAWQEAEARVGMLGGIEFTRECVAYLNTCTVEEAGAWFYEHSPAYQTPDDAIALIDTYMQHYYDVEVRALPGALEFLAALHEAGIPVAVLSSSPMRYLEAGLATCGYLPYIDHVVSSEEKGLSKREPDVFLLTLNLLGSDCADTWMVEDSFYSLATARSLGMRTLGIYSNDNSGTKEQLAAHADFVFGSLGELGFDGFMKL